MRRHILQGLEESETDNLYCSSNSDELRLHACCSICNDLVEAHNVRLERESARLYSSKLVAWCMLLRSKVSKWFLANNT
jgi:hypothetical protein